MQTDSIGKPRVSVTVRSAGELETYGDTIAAIRAANDGIGRTKFLKVLLERGITVSDKLLRKYLTNNS